MNSEIFLSAFIQLFQLFSLLPPNKLQTTPFNFKYFCFIFWSIINIGIALLELTLIYVYKHETFHQTSVIGEILDIIQVFAPIFTHLIMIAETLTKVKLTNEMWQLMSEIEVEFSVLCIKNFTFMKRFILKFILCIILGVTSEIAVIASIYQDFEAFTRSWYFRIWSINIVRFGIMEIILYTEWIGTQMDSIAFGLETVAAKKKASVELYLIKNVHSKLWLFSDKYNRRFRWSILMMMINFSICITIGLYWVITRISFSVYDLMFRKYLSIIIVCIFCPVFDFIFFKYGFALKILKIPIVVIQTVERNRVFNGH